MKALLKPLAVAGVAGAMALASVSASDARPRGWAAAGVGFAAGALVGAAAANAHNRSYYDGGYAYAPGYYAEPGYAHSRGRVYYDAPGYDAYGAYESGPVYAPGPRYYAPRHRNDSSPEALMSGHNS